MELYKSEIIIWAKFDPTKLEISDLAQDAESGEAYCSCMRTTLIEHPTKDPDWNDTDFFGEMEETEETAAPDVPTNRGDDLACLRYEVVRTLNAKQFADLFKRSIEGDVRFDDLVDEMVKERYGKK
jgi:hypothetical protein